MGAIKWWANSYGTVTNGIGWEIAKDTDALAEDDSEGSPWSLWHHGEYVGNYATVEDAKVDADSSICSKCL